MKTIEVTSTREKKKKERIAMPEAVFGVKAKPSLLAQAARVYLANQKLARPKTKTRAEVAGSGRKIWREKGTGRARHGDQYAPIFVGGGIAHGPRGFLKRSVMPQKMRKQALYGALSDKLSEGKILVVDGLEKIGPKTKDLAQFLKSLSLRDKKMLLVPSKKIAALVLAGRNLPEVKIAYFNTLNCYQVLNSQRIIFSKEAILGLKKS
ncbi:50S ribosomal protein L4 [Candidatus Shapirobacteria bacterium]|nr:50S ribosomal protein L4 [Candidatus Shapirobacteria bacterium]